MYHSLFIYLPTEGHLGCVQVLAVMNKAAVNILVKVFSWTEVNHALQKLYIFKAHCRLQYNSVAYSPYQVCASLTLSTIIVHYKEIKAE